MTDGFEMRLRVFPHAKQYPDWLGKLLTHPIAGLENYAQMMKTLTEACDAIKVFVKVAPL